MASIKVYARVRPSKRPTERITMSETSISVVTGNAETSEVTTKHSTTPQLRHDFTFARVFHATDNQEKVFETAGKEIAVKFLDGYNGTIFAYGQTGSGKTYTMEGSARKFSERGLIPRVLSFVYSELERRSDGEEFVVHISYMEIYQDSGYDLLNPGNTSDAVMTQLPKVTVTEGPDGNVRVKNLSIHLAANEEVAQNLLFQGRMNRKVAETSMNMKSSRSHAIFTIILTATAAGSEIITRSKLHLVDLAGSERVSKTGADGRILMEAKYINLSLHHLEHVIVLLQRQAGRPNSSGSATRRSHSSHDRPSPYNGINPVGCSTSSPSVGSRRQNRKRLHSSQSLQREGFVPYRNSLLTMVLKDSLGGNCLTAMIATLSVEEINLGESVSTCRFSQRVACIANSVRRNEELDDKAIIKRLKCRIAELETELVVMRKQYLSEQKVHTSRSLTDDVHRAVLTENEVKSCHRTLYDFLHGKIDDPIKAGIDDTQKFAECLVVMKQIVLHALGVDGSKAQLTQAQQSESKQQQKSDPRKVPPHKQSKTSTPKTIPASQPLSNSMTVNISPSSNPVSVQNSNHTHVIKPQLHYQHPEYPSTVRTPVSKMIQQTPTPTSLASSGIGSMYEEDATFSHSHKHIPQQYNIGVLKSSDTTEHHDENTLSPTKQHSHSHRHKRTHSERNMLSHENRDAVKVQHSISDHHKLRNEVQKLTLSVEEEEIRGQIALLREQIAGQHARILWMERSHASNEEIHQEKLAEYHLRIKEAQWQQKLMQVIKQLGSGENPAASTNVQYLQQLKDEMSNYKKQDKIQEQIEDLKQVQMEKQLLLKEAATRKKLLALKQQLQTDSGLRATNNKLNEVSNKNVADADTAVAPKTAQSEKLHIPEHEDDVRLSMSMNGNFPTKLSIKSPQPSQASPPSTITTSTNTNIVNGTISRDKSTAEEVKKSKYKRSSFSSLLLHTTALLDDTSTPDHKPELIASVDKTKQTVSPPNAEKKKVNNLTETKSCANSSSNDTIAKAAPPNPKPTTRQRLAVPDTIKETEYMSAVTKQKTRVSKIRRAIQAAIVIQRAWRKYKQNHKLSQAHS